MKPANQLNNDDLVNHLAMTCEAVGETRAIRAASQILGDIRGELRAECKARLNKATELQAANTELEAARDLLIARNEQLKAAIADDDDALARMRNRENELRILLTKTLNNTTTLSPSRLGELRTEFDAYQAQNKTGPYANG